MAASKDGLFLLFFGLRHGSQIIFINQYLVGTAFCHYCDDVLVIGFEKWINVVIENFNDGEVSCIYHLDC